MAWKHFLCLLLLYITTTNAVRLHKLFQFLEGYRSEHGLKGFLHIGKDYAVFIQLPKPHDKFLVYELYEARHLADTSRSKPKMMALARIPIEYIKEQLRTYRSELYNTKFVDDNVIPGTQVRTLKEWQMDNAVKIREAIESMALRPDIDPFGDKTPPKEQQKD